ncbi:hypothetical protein B0J14DRAFT_325359 [Halenospora varia]|nr:hypothetical protein B0J14DRAFT_325359 [Halenospora varia]
MIMVSLRIRDVVVSSSNQGPVVNIAAWFGISVVVICVITRISSKLAILRRWTTDDTLILATMMFAIAHTITLTNMVACGLGQPQDSLTLDMIEKFQKTCYASDLLYIPVLCLAKLSTLVYLKTLSPGSKYALVNQALEVIILIWGIASELAVAFQCHFPHPWAIITAQCTNRIVLWDTIGVFDILTDFAIIILPACLVWKVQMQKAKKVLVVFIFGTRIIITPLIIFRLYYLHTASSPSQPDQTFSKYHIYLATTIQLNVAIVATCIPFLKPFLQALNSGGYAGDIEAMDSSYGFGGKLSAMVSSRGHSKSSRPPKGAFRMESIPDIKTKAKAKPLKSEPSQNQNTSTTGRHFSPPPDENDIGPLRPDKIAFTAHIHSAVNRNRSTSSTGSEKMIIKRTTEWNVSEDFEDGINVREVSREVSRRKEVSRSMDSRRESSRPGYERPVGEWTFYHK